jgi:hypothetical protein
MQFKSSKETIHCVSKILSSKYLKISPLPESLQGGVSCNCGTGWEEDLTLSGLNILLGEGNISERIYFSDSGMKVKIFYILTTIRQKMI